MRGTPHTESERARVVAMAVVTGTKRAARAAGVSQRSVERWVDDPRMAKLVQEKKEEVRDHFWAGLQVGLESVIEGFKGKATLQSRAIALGILFDKWALLSGEATSRMETRDLADELNDHERELLGDAIRRELGRRTDARPEEATVVSAGETGATPAEG